MSVARDALCARKAGVQERGVRKEVRFAWKYHGVRDQRCRFSFRPRQRKTRVKNRSAAVGWPTVTKKRRRHRGRDSDGTPMAGAPIGHRYPEAKRACVPFNWPLSLILGPAGDARLPWRSKGAKGVNGIRGRERSVRRPRKGAVTGRERCTLQPGPALTAHTPFHVIALAHVPRRNDRKRLSRSETPDAT